MQDLDAIEAINADQIVTATDWLLLRGVRKSRPRTQRETFHAQLAPSGAASVRRSAPKMRTSTFTVVAAGLVAACASLAITVACLLT